MVDGVIHFGESLWVNIRWFIHSFSIKCDGRPFWKVCQLMVLWSGTTNIGFCVVHYQPVGVDILNSGWHHPLWRVLVGEHSMVHPCFPTKCNGRPFWKVCQLIVLWSG